MRERHPFLVIFGAPAQAGHRWFRATRQGFVDYRREVLGRVELDGLDPTLACPFGNRAREALPPPDLGLTKSTGRRGGSVASRL